MLARYLLLRDCVTKALIDLKMANKLHLEEDHVELKELLDALIQIRMCVDGLSRRDTNLLKRDGILRFLFDVLGKQTSPVSQELYTALRYRLSERRQQDITSLIKFLHRSDELENDAFFEMLSKKVMVKLGKSLLTRLSISGDYDQEEKHDDDITVVEDVAVTEGSLSSALETAISSSMRAPQDPNQCQGFKSLNQEFTVYEATGKRTQNLDGLYNHLLTIRPTSIDSERAFSNANNFVTRLRNRLSDRSINTLCFLKDYFTQHK